MACKDSGQVQNRYQFMNKLSVAKEIVTLKRDKERIVFNAEYVNPVYFPQAAMKR